MSGRGTLNQEVRVPGGRGTAVAQPERTNSDAEARERALGRAHELREFYSHLAVYIIVIAALVVIDLLTGDGWWFYWAAIGWGIAIALHALRLFGQVGPFGKDWEERKADEIMRRERERDSR